MLDYPEVSTAEEKKSSLAQTGELMLRELQAEDLPTLNHYRNDPDWLQSLGSPFRYVGLATDANWFANYLANRHLAVRLAILEARSGLLCGVVNLTNLCQINRSAEFSIALFPQAQGKGYGKAATKAMLQHGFYDQNLNRIYLTVLASNKRAIALYKKLGFQQEGLEREALYKQGSYHNVVRMALLRKEFID